MLIYNPNSDIICDVPVEQCQLTWRDLSNMARRCLVEERKCIDNNDILGAIRYTQIWSKIFKAMSNPIYFLER